MNNQNEINPADFDHPDDYAKAFASAYKGFFPTYFSNLSMGWEITKETEKAVLLCHEHWFPKSQILIQGGKVIGVKKAWYNRIMRSASRSYGF